MSYAQRIPVNTALEDAAASRSRSRQTVAAKGRWFTISEAALANYPNLKALYVDHVNATADFMAAYSKAIAKQVAPGQGVVFSCRGGIVSSAGIVEAGERRQGEAASLEDVAG